MYRRVIQAMGQGYPLHPAQYFGSPWTRERYRYKDSRYLEGCSYAVSFPYDSAGYVEWVDAIVHAVEWRINRKN